MFCVRSRRSIPPSTKLSSMLKNFALRLPLSVCGILLLSQCANAQLRSTPVEAFRVPENFAVELVYEVPLDKQGSWVAMAVDNTPNKGDQKTNGTLIVSDQYGGLYRVYLDDENDDTASSVLAKSDNDLRIVPIAQSVGMVQGICPTTDGLYVNINGNAGKGSGTYRLQDLDNDGSFETTTHIIPIKGSGEHGPHAIIPGSDGRLYMCCGDASELPENIVRSRVPKVWGNDFMLGRMPDGRGFMADNMGPGGFVVSFKPDGSDLELVALGFRNEYDIAFNKNDDLFSYDADMEWDVGTPWYRPTRVNHVVSGVDFGWRNGTGKYPPYAADSFGSVVDIGYGSPTGIAFAYDTNFPEPYRSSLLIGDWSYGVIYSLALDPVGGTYTADAKPFISAAPMPVTDVVARPQDGCLYFTVGGRKVQSTLYRLRYNGPADQQTPITSMPAESKLRKQLERYHTPVSDSQQAQAINLAVQHLGNSDRSIRSAARIVLEHLPIASWIDSAMKQTQAQARITAAIAIARRDSQDSEAKNNPPKDGDAAQLETSLIDSLSSIDWNATDEGLRLELLRAYQLVMIRLGQPSTENSDKIFKQLDSHFPTTENQPLVNRELANVLIYLDAPQAIDRSVSLMKTSPSYDDQIHFALDLRAVKKGWTEATRRDYFQWFFDVEATRGGNSMGGFLKNIRQEAIKHLTDSNKKELGRLIKDVPKPIDPAAALAARTFVKDWTVDELSPESIASLVQPDAALLAKGKSIFAAAQCYQCHRFAGQGGIQGPDLTAARGRFSDRDLLTSIVEPNREISDQYQATQFLTEDKVVTGRVANLHGNTLSISTNMLDPGNFVTINRDEILETKPSPVSMMPSGLLNTFSQEEINSLILYLRHSRK